MLLPALVLASVATLSAGMEAEEAIEYLMAGSYPAYMTPPPSADKPCVLNQFCKRDNGQAPDTPCPSVSEIYRPHYGPFPTKVISQ